MLSKVDLTSSTLFRLAVQTTEGNNFELANKNYGHLTATSLTTVQTHLDRHHELPETVYIVRKCELHAVYNPRIANVETCIRNRLVLRRNLYHPHFIRCLFVPPRFRTRTQNRFSSLFRLNIKRFIRLWPRCEPNSSAVLRRKRRK